MVGAILAEKDISHGADDQRIRLDIAEDFRMPVDMDYILVPRHQIAVGRGHKTDRLVLSQQFVSGIRIRPKLVQLYLRSITNSRSYFGCHIASSVSRSSAYFPNPTQGHVRDRQRGSQIACVQQSR